MDEFDQQHDTSESAAEKIALRLKTAREKQSLGPQDVTNWLNPGGEIDWSRWGMAGAGLGGLAGLASSFNKDKEERRPFSSALTGALAGGAMLGGGAAAYANRPDFLRSAPSLRSQPSDHPMMEGLLPGSQEYQQRWQQLNETAAEPGMLPSIAGAAGRGAAGAAGGSLLSSAFSPAMILGGKDGKPPGGIPAGAAHLADIGTPVKDQYRGIWEAFRGRGKDINRALSPTPIMQMGQVSAPPQLTNSMVRGVVGKRLARGLRSWPGLLLGAGAAALPYLSPEAFPVPGQQQ